MLPTPNIEEIEQREKRIDELEAGRELDRNVEEIVFGKTWDKNISGHYSTDGSSAQMIINRMAEKGWAFNELPTLTSMGNSPYEIASKTVEFQKPPAGFVSVRVEPPSESNTVALCKAAVLAKLHDLRIEYNL